MSLTATEILEQHEKAVLELHKANLALLGLVRSQVKESEARFADDDEWTRMPSEKLKERCHVSGWSRSTIVRRSKEKDSADKPRVRTKSVKGAAYYSAADVRRYINAQ